VHFFEFVSIIKEKEELLHEETTEFSKGKRGIDGWLTHYKRFNVLSQDKRLDITIGDIEHLENYIPERDVTYIASLGMDHIRLDFDQIVLEEQPYV
jgi:hypothetical protein